MVSPVYRIIHAPLRSFAFAVFGGLTLANASVTLGELTSQAVAGVFPLAVLGGLAATASYLGWREKYARSDAVPRLALARCWIALAAVLSVLSILGPHGGIVAAVGFVLLALSLHRVRPDRSRLIEVHRTRSLISDSHASAAH